ncbi:GTD-binding domain-containing protein [Dioscorea alata]|uniref:GTD-binding domain-containing protein n=2 Tax=Dioscorea alata TaxID=55571 RepID=A0ACB7ULA1_DIOAL|nr:GTD-binding domain-containing protein [Dioscorea alata]KAH7661296.1 GTD-binding domain-containing protein [Dioscorea alata]
MAASTPASEQRISRQLSSVLSSAVLEWFLILLLFIHALFSYLVTKFARSCKLKTPCLFCSRLDHILGNEKSGFYMRLICNSHKSEISSWAFCHVHQKLADVHEMCDGCLLSLPIEKSSCTGAYKKLISKLGVGLDDKEDTDLASHPVTDGDHSHSKSHGEDGVQVPLLKKDTASAKTRWCSCCSEPFTDSPYSLLKSKLFGSEVPDISLSSPAGCSQPTHRSDPIKSREMPLGNAKIYNTENDGFARHPHVGYSELKISSDTESEALLSDDDDRNALIHPNEVPEEASCQTQPVTVDANPNNSTVTLSVDITTEKLIQPDPALLEPLISVTEPHHLDEHREISSPVSGPTVHGLDEISWSRVEVTEKPLVTSGSVAQTVPVEVSHAKSTFVPALSSGEFSKSVNSNELNSGKSQILNNLSPTLHIPMDLNDAYKLAVGGKGSLPSPSFTEIVTGRDSTRVHEDLKVLLSQISASRGFEFPWNDVSPSPRLQGLGDESIILQNITKRLSIERNESGVESLDGSIVSEIEGESPIDRLKRQIELDRKSMSMLYKELEEERNASAIAANQAMAMITRLQEEKAGMQMEALQYQRMMEEQAEYDQEALQKTNELLTQREKELQDLETELECYRKRFSGEPLSDKFMETSSHLEVDEKNLTNSARIEESTHHKKSVRDVMVSLDPCSTLSDPLKDPLSDFEDEKIHITECLKKLERKLQLFSSGTHAYEGDIYDEKCELANGLNHEQENIVSKDSTSNGHYSVEEAGSSDPDYPQWDDMGQNGAHVVDNVHVKRSASQFSSKENHKERLLQCDVVQDAGCFPLASEESDSAALRTAILQLNERLMELEADRNFLEHAINSLRNGNDGVQFIREIACYVRDLRKIGITTRDHSAS